MNFFDVMMLFDSHTMLSVLFWSNLFLTALVFTFETTSINTHDKVYIHKAFIVRLAYSIAYLILLCGRFLPNFVSSNLGISILIFCFYLDARLILHFSSAYEKKHLTILTVMLAVGIVVFNIVEVIHASHVFRSIISSCVILAIYGLPTVLFIANKNNSRFKHFVGGFYVLFLISLTPRIIIPFTETGNLPNSDELSLSGFYLVLVMITVCGTMFTMFFIKERSDIALENMALIDQLTQLPNRHSFHHNANIMFHKCQREKKDISIMFMDIDHFKKVNDNYGHDFGDVVIKRFATVIKECTRKYDIICRYGGEEFLVMLQDDKSSIAESLAQRIMERLKAECFSEYPDFKFTASIGIASGIPGEEDTLNNCIKNADTALYEAKSNGRNRVELFKNSI